jgi:hypothetical protein
MTDYSLTADESAEVRLTAFSLVFVRTGGRVLGGIGRYWGSWQSIDNSSMKQYQSIFRKKDILLTHATSYQHIPTKLYHRVLAFGALLLTTTSLQEAKKDVQQPATASSKQPLFLR